MQHELGMKKSYHLGMTKLSPEESRLTLGPNWDCIASLWSYGDGVRELSKVREFARDWNVLSKSVPMDERSLASQLE